MGRMVVYVALFAVVGLGVAGFAAAQDAPGTPGADSEFCASPEGSPATSPEASPEIVTDASPAVVATEVVEEIEGGLSGAVCGTPSSSPAA